MSHLRSLGVVVMLAALPATSRAYERSIHDETGACLYWPARALTYRINPDRGGTAPSCGGPPASSAAIQAVVSGFTEWTEATHACTDLALTRGADTAAIAVGYSSGGGENLVVFRHGWCDENAEAKADPCWTDPAVRCSSKFNCFGEAGQNHSTIALTTTTYRPSTGEIVDADMELVDWTGAGAGTGIASDVPQGYYFTCLAPSGLPACVEYGEGDCYSQDLENTVTHEVGHFIGFAHDFDNQDSTMWWQASRGEIGKRDLEASDVDGLCAVYASGKAALSCVKKQDDSGGCATGGGAGVLGLLGLLSLRRPRRAQRTTTAA